MSARTDVAVVGGGAVGLCTAYYLHQAGAAVTLLDKGGMGQACSLHNAGFVCPSHFVPLAAPGIIAQGLRWMLNPVSPFYLKPRLDFEFLKWVWTFHRSCTPENVRRAAPLLRDLGNESLKLYEQLAGIPGMDFDFTRRGLIVLFRTEHGRAAQQEEAELSHRVGISAELLGRDKIQRLVPDVEVRAAGGLFFPDDAHLTPARFVESLTRLLESRGVVMHANTEVKRFRKSAERVSAVETSAGTISADEFVLAGGAWSPLLARDLGLTLPVQAGKGYSLTVDRKDRKPAIPLILSEARVAITPMAETIRFAGTMELAGLDLSITQRRVDAILHAVPHYIGGFAPSDFVGARPWAGLRPVSPDGVPFVGRFKAFPNLVAATGHAMVGISLAPVTGKIVGDLIGGKTTGFDLHLMRPDRFS